MSLAIRILVGGLLAIVVATGSVCAAEPDGGVTDPGTAPAVQGIETIGFVPAADRLAPAQLGYTAADVAAKDAAAAGYAAAALLAASGKTPLGYVPSGSLAGYVQYHQKTSHWCLAAVIQSILRYKFSAGWIQPSVLVKQTEIDAAISSGAPEIDTLGLAYINTKFGAYGSPFRYVYKGRATSWNQLSGWIQMDVSSKAFPTYVSVNVSSSYYVWRQSSYAIHATAAIGYASYGAVARIGDPFTSPSTGPAYCNTNRTNPSYSSAPDIGCVYGAWDMQKYYLASTTSWI